MLCLLDPKARVFAIRACKSNEAKGFKFSKPKGEQKGVVTISNKNLLDPLRRVIGEEWVSGKRYKVRGFWVADAPSFKSKHMVLASTTQKPRTLYRLPETHSSPITLRTNALRIAVSFSGGQVGTLVFSDFGWL